MASTNITQLPLPRNRKVRKAVTTPRPARAPVTRYQRAVAYGCAAVGAMLLLLSLQHLATGIVAITGCSWLEAMLLACGIDAGLIAVEMAALVASPAAARSIRLYVVVTITATLTLSAGLNAYAFSVHSVGVMVYASCAFGVFVPMMVYALCRIAVGLTSR